MTYQSHAAWALAGAALLYPLHVPATTEDFRYAAIWGFSALLGGLMPDIDHPQSKIGRIVPIIPTLLYKSTGHRGATHSALACLVYTLLVFAGFYLTSQNLPLAYFVAQASCIGYSSHLLGDFLTNRGIPVAWPLKRRFGVPITNTRSQGEYFITLIMVCAVAGTFFM